MKQITLIIIAITLLSILVSCNKDENGKNQSDYDCVFEQNDNDMDGLIDDTEKMIMDECMENSLSSKSKIENNLIGEWELVGHGEGWFPSISQPCGYIIISEDDLTFEFRNENNDIASTYQWEIEEVSSSGGIFFKLEILPEPPEGLIISRFCDNYMFSDATPRDGNMYLYKKVD